MVLSFFLLQNLVVLRISEPCGPLPFPSEPRGSPCLLQNHMALFLSPRNLMVLSSLQNRVVFSLLLQNLMALFLSPQNLVVLSTLWLPRLG